MKKRLGSKYFLLSEVCFLSLMATLVYVFKTFLRTPMLLPGHNAVFWVIPFIIGLGLTRKFGSATYIGLLSGLLVGTIGMNDEGILKVFEYIAMGFTIDALSLAFKGHLSNLLVGLMLGAFGSFSKMIVNYNISMLVYSNQNIVLAGIGVAGTVHLVFGGAGGIIAALIVNRVQHVYYQRQKPAKERASSPQQMTSAHFSH
jgi:hypothetical protein